MLKDKVRMALKMWKDHWRQHLVDVSLCVYTISASLTNVPKDDWTQKMAQPNGTPDHDAGASPGVNLQDVLVVVTFTGPPPDTDPAVCLADAVAALIRKEDVPPLSPSPIATMLGPREPLLTMSPSQDRAHSWTATVQASLSKTSVDGFSRDGSSVAPNGRSGCFRGRTEGITTVLPHNLTILSCCRHSRSTAP